jgi:hypothetical protein
MMDIAYDEVYSIKSIIIRSSGDQLGVGISNRIIHSVRWRIGFDCGIYDVSRHVKEILNFLIKKR